jgi:hypothetical protein
MGRTMSTLRLNHIGAGTVLGTMLTALVLAGCNSSYNAPAVTPQDVTLKVTLQNLTTAQPFTPPLLVVGDASTVAWSEGQTATVELEKLAESGISDTLSALLKTKGGNVQVVSTAPILWGANASYTLSYPADAARTLTVATMLGNTNDAFTGITGLPVGQMAVGERIERRMPAWDAGTEAHTETKETIPGPATQFKGEGFNPVRDDSVNIVHYHPGIVSADDGLTTSILKAKHRFDNPVLLMTVERLK